jgi:hypothetical protein
MIASMHFRAAVLLSLIVFTVVVASGQSAEVSCAAFGADGAWATAVMSSGKLTFEMHVPNAPAKALDIHANGNPELCRLFLSADRRFAAVGVRASAADGDELQIAVFDRSASKWASSFVVKQREDLWFKLRFEGFLGGGSQIVVTGITKSKPRDDVNLKVLLFDPDGQPMADAVFDRTLPRSNRNWDADAVDARSNRLWFVGSPQFCPVKSVTLTGAVNYGPSITGTVVGGRVCLPDAIGFPQADVVVGANAGNENSVWRVDVNAETGEKIELPQVKPAGTVKWNGYAISPITDVSPDGEVFVVARSVTAWDTFDRSHGVGGELDIIQTKPLKLIGVIALKGGCDFGGVAVEHRNGETTVLQRRCGKWERESFSKP